MSQNTETPRRAKIRLNAPELQFHLNIPEGLRIVGIQAHNDPVSFVLLVEGESLDPVDWDSEAPYLRGNLVREQVVVNGMAYYRDLWATGGAAA